MTEHRDNNYYTGRILNDFTRVWNILICIPIGYHII